MNRNSLEERIQAHCQVLSAGIHTLRTDQIKNRLAYIVANAEALIELREESKEAA